MLTTKPVRHALALALGLTLSQGAAHAQVSAEEAAKLGNSLTPVGAVEAGNAAGTIPAWQGGFRGKYQVPAGYEVGQFHIDPFAEDKKLFTISAENVDQYADQLSAGQVALIKKYPETYKLHVYPTRRTASYPDTVYAAVKRNATNAKLVADGNGVENMELAIPFPIPSNGVEAVWNHLTRYRGEAVQVFSASAAPQINGDYYLEKQKLQLVFNNEFMGTDHPRYGNIIFMFKEVTTEPTRRAGDVLLVHETLNQAEEPRLAWTYSAGQRRVRRAPQIAFDTARGIDGLRTSDGLDIFNGSPERYNWKLEGKREMYIPYNNYAFARPENRYEDIITPGHPNTDKMRYELHRVWVVTGTLKEGMRHLYAKRTLYIDEDSWEVVMADQYDGRGELMRFSEAYGIQYYDADLFWNVGETHHDLIAGRYLITTLANEEPGPRDFTFKNSPEANLVNFTPSALRREGIR